MKRTPSRKNQIHRAWLKAHQPPKLIIHGADGDLFLVDGIEVDKDDYDQAYDCMARHLPNNSRTSQKT